MTEIIKLEFTQIGKQGIVSWDTAQDRKGIFTLPWQDATEWSAVYQSLKLFSKDTTRIVPNGPVRQKAVEKGLCDAQGVPLPQRIRILGQELYNAIFATQALEQAFREAVRAASRPTVIFHFSEEGSFLQTYPWEIMHDGEEYLFKSRASIVRHVDFQGHITPIALNKQLPIFLADPRPVLPPRYEPLPLLDRQVIREQLGSNARLRPVILEDDQNDLSFDKFLTQLSNYHNQTKIIHIDTHGDYGRTCHQCNMLFAEATCPQCGTPANNTQPLQGHLAFEHADGFEWIGAERLGEVFAHRNITLVVITACSSALTGQGTAFNSVAGALIKYGVPAVVAMQFPVEDRSTQQFVQHFYQILVRDKFLASAVQIARASIQSVAEGWYRPAVYLRTNTENMLGRLFYSPKDWFQQHNGNGIGDFLTIEDVEEAKANHTNAVLGQRPTFSHVRDGKYMVRYQLVEEIADQLDNLLYNLDDDVLTVFWIYGRSGSGKSVLLLQVVQRLVFDRNSEVIWLGSNSAALPKLLQVWADDPPPSDTNWYVAIDDLYGPERLNKSDLEQISNIVGDNPDVDFPTILTCGPTYQLENFKSDVDETYLVKAWEMPLISEDEALELQQWYKTTTSKDPVMIGEAFEQNEGLILSMMVEMLEGRIEQYAKRFARRVEEDLVLVQALVPILALNRLYIYPPRAWLTEEQDDALRRFNHQQDLSVELNEASSPNDGIRLTHPHLSNDFYLALRRRDDDIVRARDLSQAFARAIAENARLASEIILAFSQQSDRMAIVDSQRLVESVTRTFNENYKAENFSFNERLYMWLHLLKWGNEESSVLSSLRSHPGDVLLESLNQYNTSKSWSYVWSQTFHLLRERDRLENFLDIGMAWLADNSRDLGWSYVFQQIAERARQMPTPKIRELVTLMFAWLRQNTSHSGWPFTFVNHFHLTDHLTAQEQSRLFEMGIQWLQTYKDAPRWQLIYIQLIEHRAGFSKDQQQLLYRSAIHWLESQTTDEKWPIVYLFTIDKAHILTASEMDGLLQAGMEWIQTQQGAPRWYAAYGKMIEQMHNLTPDEQASLVGVGIQWLKTHDYIQGWSLVYGKLVENMHQVPADNRSWLIDMGIRSLRERTDVAGLPYTFNRLLTQASKLAQQERDQIVNATLTWLRDREASNNWPHAYGQMIRRRNLLSVDQQQHLIQAGYDWIKVYTDNSRWFVVWNLLRKLLQAQETDGPNTGLLQYGVKWLETSTTSSQWGLVYAQIARSNKDLSVAEREKLCNLGLNWLNDNMTNQRWTYVFDIMLNIDLCDTKVALPQSYQYGIEWLINHTAHYNWPIVYKTLTKTGENLTESQRFMLIEIGTEWLKDRDLMQLWRAKKSWMVYRGVASLGHFLTEPQRELLVAVAMHWLETYPLEGQNYNTDTAIHSLIRYDDALNTEQQLWLIDIGKQWLLRNPTMISWDFLFSDLFHRAVRSSSDDVDWLMETGLNWLNNHIDSSTWPYVFATITYFREHIHDPIDTRLLVLGAKWRSALTEQVSNWNWKTYKNALKVFNQVIAELQSEVLEEGIPFDVGDTVEGVVTGVKRYGVFLNVNGVNGLLHISEMAHHHVDHPSDMLSLGDVIEVAVIGIDKVKGEDRISFSRKALIPDPWPNVTTNLKVGDVTTGVVSQIEAYGVFILLDVGITALLHRSETTILGNGKLKQYFKKGDQVEVMVLSIDEDQQRVALTIDQMRKADSYDK